MNAEITALGSYLPEKTLTNDDFLYLDTSDEWIRQRTGIETRHIASDTENASDIAIKVANDIIKKSPISASEIDGIIIATATHHQAIPSIASIVADHLDAEEVFTLDINAACSGFIYGMQLAQSLVPSQCKHLLVIGVDTMSKIVDWQDRASCILFGDGGAGVLISASDKQSIQAVRCLGDGSGRKYLYTNGDRWRNKACHVQMQGKEVFRWAVTKQAKVTKELLEKNNISIESIDWCIPHQANKRLISSLLDNMQIALEKAIITVHKHANTSAASIPLAWCDAVENNRVKKGQRLLLQAFGAGFTWGAAIIDY